MSLVAWYPLNGDTINQGIENMSSSSSNPTFTNEGKIGKGLLNGGQITWTPEQSAKFFNNKALSICFWIKVTNTSLGQYNYPMIFGNSAMGANNNRKFSIFHYPNANDLHLSWMNDAANATWFSTFEAGFFPTNEWCHVAITYNNPDIKIYKNGVLNKSFTGVSNSSSFAYSTTAVYSPSNCRVMNDYRFYDHCLSPKEVGELAQGLILHYPMTDSIDLDLDKNVIYDTSGYRRNATYTDASKPSWASGDAPLGLGSYVFNGSTTYLNAGTGAQVTDEITVCWWGKMADWSKFKRSISCTENGGWNFEPSSTMGRMEFIVRAGGTYYLLLDSISLSSISASSWHFFAGTYDGKEIKFYRDGVCTGAKTVSSTKLPIQYHASNSILVGAEPANGAVPVGHNYFAGNLCDVRIYATALNDEAIEKLYSVREVVMDNGSVLADNYIEDAVDSVNAGANGVITAQDFGAGMGRENLLLGTNTTFSLAANNSNYHYTRIYTISNLPAGQYTISGDVQVTAGTITQITARFYGTSSDTNNGNTTHFTLTNGHFEGKITKISNATKGLLLYAGRAGATANNGCVFSNIKLERGKGATPWAPSIEDTTAVTLKNDVDSAKIYDDALIAYDLHEWI